MVQMRDTFACIVFASMLFSGLSVLAQTGNRPLSNSEKARIEEARKLENTSSTKFQEGRYAEACELGKQVLRIYESIYGPEHQEVSTSLVNLAHIHGYLSQYEDAEKLLIRAIKIDEKTLAPNDKNAAGTLQNLAALYLQQGKFSASEPLFLRSLTNFESNYGNDHPNVAVVLCNLASAKELQGKYQEAEPLIKRALKIYEQKLGTGKIETGNCLKQLAGLYQSKGEFAAAEQTYLRAKVTVEQAVGPNHPNFASILNDLAGMYVDLGNYAAAKPLFDRALRICESQLNANNSLTASVVCNLATLSMTEGDYSRAEPLFRRAYDGFAKVLGPDDPRTAACAVLLGTLKARQHDFVLAEQFLSRAMKSLESSLGPDHLQTGRAMSSLGELRARNGDLDTAEPLLRRSMAITEKTLPPGHPFITTCLLNLAVLKQKTNDASEADAFFDRVQKSARIFNAGVLPSLSENEQTMYIEERFTTSFFQSLSFGLVRKNEQSIERSSASWLVNGKAVGLESRAQRNLLSREANNPKLASVAKELQEVRAKLSNLAMVISKPEHAGEMKVSFDKLVDQEQRLSKQLSAASGFAENSDWIDISKIQETLRHHTAYIDIARFDVFDFAAVGSEKTWKPARYAAWITQGGDRGSTVVIDLGNADEIDALVNSVRISIPKGASQVKENGEADATMSTTRELASLADKIWKPLESELAKTDGEINEILLSPDGSLWMLPWACLPLSDNSGKVLLEKYTIRFVTSGRDLKRISRKIETSKPIVFANPNFDLTASEKRKAIEAVFRKPLAAGDAVARDVRSIALLPKVESLPGTGIEALETLSSIESWAKVKPAIFQQQDALERVAKVLRHPKSISFATHGFFLPVQKVDRAQTDFFAMSNARSIAIDKTGNPVGNPLLRCGLLLSGCNSQSSIIDDDGILTGLEIVGIDLRGTEMVVLSACETGVGDIRNGEGIAGLRQAFQLAGAQSVVSSLWQVPDRESTQIMIDFYANLAAGQTRAASLRNAQLKMIESRREFFGAAHPYYWAAWTVTGHDH